MRRVVVTGMGIVSSIGNNTQEVLASLREAKSGITHAEEYAKPASAARCRARRRSIRRDRSTAAPCASSARARPGTTSPWSRRSAIPASRKTTSPIRAPASSWARAAPRPRPWSRPPTSRAKKVAQAHRPVRGAEGDVVDRLGDARHLVQDQGRQLFDLVGLRDLQPLHRQRLRADPVGQAGHGVRRRLARSSTGRCRTCSTPWAPCRPNTTTRRQTASRAYDKDRDGFVIAGGAGVLVLEELEHAKARGAKIYAEVAGYGATSDGYDMVAPSGEGARALHEDGAGDRARRRSTTSIRTPPRRRSATSRRSRRSARCSAPSARRFRPPSR